MRGSLHACAERQVGEEWCCSIAEFHGPARSARLGKKLFLVLFYRSLYLCKMPGKKRKSTAKAPAVCKKRSLTKDKAPVATRKKYRQWTEESMVGALKAVKEGTMGLNRAATEFGVPKTTLKNRVSGRVTHGCKAGRATYLTHAEEEEFYESLVVCASIGYPKRRGEVIGIVRKTLEKKSSCPVEDFKGKGWWQRFMQRWHNLTLRKGDALAQPRANAVNATNINNYFDLLEKNFKNMNCLTAPI